MKTLPTPKQITATKNFIIGTYSKGTYYRGKIGEDFNVIGETKVYFITDNLKNNKLPKWATE